MDKKLFIKTYNSILRIKNILTSFDEFEGKEILTERNFQDCKSKYLYICEEFRNKNNGDSEIINDDIIFENELIKHDDIDVDYILRLI
jgi:type I restriction enzyme R subunit